MELVAIYAQLRRIAIGIVFASLLVSPQSLVTQLPLPSALPGFLFLDRSQKRLIGGVLFEPRVAPISVVAHIVCVFLGLQLENFDPAYINTC